LKNAVADTGSSISTRDGFIAVRDIGEQLRGTLMQRRRPEQGRVHGAPARALKKIPALAREFSNTDIGVHRANNP